MATEPKLRDSLRGAGVLAEAALSLGRSYRRFEWKGAEDERYVARTPDGWNLALYRYRPKGIARPFPIVCSHGMAGTRLIYDLHPDYSLARYLAGRGFDTWLVDLRGSSRAASGVATSIRSWRRATSATVSRTNPSNSFHSFATGSTGT